MNLYRLKKEPEFSVLTEIKHNVPIPKKKVSISEDNNTYIHLETQSEYTDPDSEDHSENDNKNRKHKNRKHKNIKHKNIKHTDNTSSDSDDDKNDEKEDNNNLFAKYMNSLFFSS